MPLALLCGSQGRLAAVSAEQPAGVLAVTGRASPRPPTLPRAAQGPRRSFSPGERGSRGYGGERAAAPSAPAAARPPPAQTPQAPAVAAPAPPEAPGGTREALGALGGACRGEGSRAPPPASGGHSRRAGRGPVPLRSSAGSARGAAARGGTDSPGRPAPPAARPRPGPPGELRPRRGPSAAPLRGDPSPPARAPRPAPGSTPTARRLRACSGRSALDGGARAPVLASAPAGPSVSESEISQVGGLRGARREPRALAMAGPAPRRRASGRARAALPAAPATSCRPRAALPAAPAASGAAWRGRRCGRG